MKKSSVTGIKGGYEYCNIALVYGIAEKTLLPALREALPYTYRKCFHIRFYGSSILFP